MITNNSATIWHYDEDAEIYLRSIFAPIWAYGIEKTTADQKGGRTNKKTLTVRIPTTEDISVYVHTGDYIRIGLSEDSAPNRGIDNRITEISDNRRGRSPHWRIKCE